MSNLGVYQTLTTIAKKAGGPTRLVAIIAVGGYGILRASEAGAKRAVRTIKERSAPCATKGQVFRVTSEGNAGGAKMRVGDEYRVLECDGDAILIEVLGDLDSPYFVSSKFLSSVSDFPRDV
jgi:hypothetical protein